MRLSAVIAVEALAVFALHRLGKRPRVLTRLVESRRLVGDCVAGGRNCHHAAIGGASPRLVVAGDDRSLCPGPTRWLGRSGAGGRVGHAPHGAPSGRPGRGSEPGGDDRCHTGGGGDRPHPGRGAQIEPARPRRTRSLAPPLPQPPPITRVSSTGDFRPCPTPTGASSPIGRGRLLAHPSGRRRSVMEPATGAACPARRHPGRYLLSSAGAGRDSHRACRRPRRQPVDHLRAPPRAGHRPERPERPRGGQLLGLW